MIQKKRKTKRDHAYLEKILTQKRETILPLDSILCVYVDEIIERLNGMNFITF